MVKEFIKPVNKERKLWNFLYHYLVKPPLVYHRDAPTALQPNPVEPPKDKAEVNDVVVQPAPTAPPKAKAEKNAALDKRPRLNIKSAAKNQSKRTPTYKEKPIRINFSALVKRIFIITFGVDGFDHTTSTTVFAENISGPRKLQHAFQRQSFSTGLLIASFFGLPTRTQQTAAGDQEPQLTFSLPQLLKNMFGVWDSSSDWSEKKIWEFVLFIPFKFPILFAFKLLGIILKTAVNIVKLFTEFLPQIITNIIATGFFNATEKLRFIASKNIHPAMKFFQLFGFGIVTVGLGLVNYTCRILTLILRAATSPEKSARMAYAAGREYRIIGGRSEDEFEAFSKILGLLFASVSILMTVAVWTLTLPLVIGVLMTYLPVYVPSVFQTLSTFAQLPIVAKSLAVLNTALTPVANALLNAAGPVLSTVSTFLGVQIPSLALILGTTIGALAAPITAIASRIADELSNKWAVWHGKGNGPLNYIGALFSRMKIALENWVNPPKKTLPVLGEEEQPNKDNLQLVSKTGDAEWDAQKNARTTDLIAAYVQDAAHSNMTSAVAAPEESPYPYHANGPDLQLLMKALPSDPRLRDATDLVIRKYQLTETIEKSKFYFEIQFKHELQERVNHFEACVSVDKRNNNTRLQAIKEAIYECVAQRIKANSSPVIANATRNL